MKKKQNFSLLILRLWGNVAHCLRETLLSDAPGEPLSGSVEDHLNRHRRDDQPGDPDQRPDQVEFLEEPAERAGKEHQHEVGEDRQHQRGDAREVAVLRRERDRDGDRAGPGDQRRGQRYDRKFGEVSFRSSFSRFWKNFPSRTAIQPMKKITSPPVILSE